MLYQRRRSLHAWYDNTGWGHEQAYTHALITFWAALFFRMLLSDPKQAQYDHDADGHDGSREWVACEGIPRHGQILPVDHDSNARAEYLSQQIQGD